MLVEKWERRGKRGRTDSKTLVFPADEDSAEDVADDEDQQEDIVHTGIKNRIENAEHNQARRSNQRN